MLARQIQRCVMNTWATRGSNTRRGFKLVCNKSRSVTASHFCISMNIENKLNIIEPKRPKWEIPIDIKRAFKSVQNYKGSDHARDD